MQSLWEEMEHERITERIYDTDEGHDATCEEWRETGQEDKYRL